MSTKSNPDGDCFIKYFNSLSLPFSVETQASVLGGHYKGFILEVNDYNKLYERNFLILRL